MKIFFLTKYVQSRLLQNCRMRERVNCLVRNNSHGMLSVAQIMWNDITIQVTLCHWPFPFHFLTHLQQTAFWKHEKRRNCSKRAISPFCHHVFNSIQLLYFHLKGVSKRFWVRFQSRLLQICCMWKRVKEEVLTQLQLSKYNNLHEKLHFISNKTYNMLNSRLITLCGHSKYFENASNGFLSSELRIVGLALQQTSWCQDWRTSSTGN